MQRYTAEQKAEALKMMEETGAAMTSQALGVSKATLFKWKREAGGPASPRGRKKGPAAKKTAAKKRATKAADPATPEAATPDKTKKAAVEAARDLLKEDDGAAKIRQLEAENAALREQNAKLRKALAALID